MPIGRIFGAQTTSAWTMVEIVVCGLSRKVIGGEAVSSRGLRTMTLNDKFEKHQWCISSEEYEMIEHPFGQKAAG